MKMEFESGNTSGDDVSFGSDSDSDSSEESKEDVFQSEVHKIF